MNITRPSIGEVSVTAWVLPSRCRGTTTCVPLVSRTSGPAPQPAVRPHVAEGGEQVVQPQARPQPPRGHARAPIRREEERQWSDEVRGDREQHAPLAARFQYEAERPLLEVAQSAVDQARGVR